MSCPQGFVFNPTPVIPTSTERKVAWCVPEVPYVFINETDYATGSCRLPESWTRFEVGTIAAGALLCDKAGVLLGHGTNDPRSSPPCSAEMQQVPIDAILGIGKPHECNAPARPSREECGSVNGEWECWTVSEACTAPERAVAQAVKTLQLRGDYSEAECEAAGGLYRAAGPPYTVQACEAVEGLPMGGEEGLFDAVGLWVDGNTDSWCETMESYPYQVVELWAVRCTKDLSPSFCSGSIEPVDNPVAVVPLQGTGPDGPWPNGTVVKTVQVFVQLPPDSDYFGTKAVTKNGFICESWKTALQSPEKYSKGTAAEQEKTGDGLDPSEVSDSDRLEKNYCRNPDGRDMAWCFVSQDPLIGFLSAPLWEFCDVHGGQGGNNSPLGLQVRLAPELNTYWFDAQACENTCTGTMAPGGIHVNLDTGCGVYSCNSSVPMKYVMVANIGDSVPLSLCEIAAYSESGIEGYAPVHGSFYYSSGDGDEFDPPMESNYGDGGKTIDVYAGHPLDPVASAAAAGTFPPGLPPVRLGLGRFAPPPIHFIPDPLTYSVPLFLKRQCGRTPDQAGVAGRLRLQAGRRAR